jgi:hypothetical protein
MIADNRTQCETDIEIPGEFEGYFLDPEGYKGTKQYQSSEADVLFSLSLSLI